MPTYASVKKILIMMGVKVESAGMDKAINQAVSYWKYQYSDMLKYLEDGHCYVQPANREGPVFITGQTQPDPEACANTFALASDSGPSGSGCGTESVPNNVKAVDESALC